MSDSEEEIADTQLKIVLLGDCSCGKTSIIQKYVHNQFPSGYTPTRGLDFFHKRIILPGDVYVALRLHDVGGQAMGGAMLPNYLYGADGIVYVYDVTNSQSFEIIEEWHSNVMSIYKDQSLPNCAIAGNKVDQGHLRNVSLDRHRKFAEEYDMSSHFVSAKTGDSINLTFQLIASHITGIRLPKSSQHPDVVKADVVQYNHITPAATSRTSVCCIQ